MTRSNPRSRIPGRMARVRRNVPFSIAGGLRWGRRQGHPRDRLPSPEGTAATRSYWTIDVTHHHFGSMSPRIFECNANGKRRSLGWIDLLLAIWFAAEPRLGYYQFWGICDGSNLSRFRVCGVDRNLCLKSSFVTGETIARTRLAEFSTNSLSVSVRVSCSRMSILAGLAGSAACPSVSTSAGCCRKKWHNVTCCWH
jgi:hypothetical protein